MNFYGHQDALTVTFTFGNAASGQLAVSVDHGSATTVPVNGGVGVFVSALLGSGLHALNYIITPLAPAGGPVSVSVQVAQTAAHGLLVPSPSNVPPGNPYLLTRLAPNVGTIGGFTAQLA